MDATSGEGVVWHVGVVITGESADIHVAHDGHASSHRNGLITGDNIAANSTGRWVNALDRGIGKGMGDPRRISDLISDLALLVKSESLLADDNASWVAD